MPIQNIARFAKAISQSGSFHNIFFHKTSAPTPVARTWLDLSMGAGIPKYNAYVGSQTTATRFIGSGNDGMYLGAQPPAGKSRYINTALIQSTTNSLAPGLIVLADYLMHYPLLDGDNTDIQDMDNTLTLPRYQTGAGVMCMAVCTTPMTANAICTVNYTNSEGTPNRTSTFTLIASSNVGTIVSSSDTSGSTNSKSPFIPLANGDSGIRSIESVTLTTGSGGFFALVLVKTLTNIQMLEVGVPTEIQHIQQRGCMLPKIEDGAYLNMIALVNNTGAIAPLRGFIELGII